MRLDATNSGIHDADGDKFTMHKVSVQTTIEVFVLAPDSKGAIDQAFHNPSLQRVQRDKSTITVEDKKIMIRGYGSTQF